MSCAGYLTIKAAASRIYWNRAAGGGGGGVAGGPQRHTTSY
jgi:hypothetical protein